MTEGHIFTDIVIKPDYADFIQYQVNNIRAELGEVDKIIHHVASPGGSVYGAYKGFHKLVSLGVPIDTIVEGEAQSAASFVILASRKTGGKIKVLNPSRIMIHEPRISSESLGTEYLVSDDLQRNADELRKIETEMGEIYMEATCTKKCMTIEEIKSLMKKETNMTAREAVALGFADEVITSINMETNVKLKAVALGKKMDPKAKTNFQKVGEFLTEAGKLMGIIEAAAVDLPLKTGGMIHIESENGDLVGKPVTIDGKPAAGTYDLEDGRSVTCVGGVVTAVKDAAAAAAPPPAALPAPAPPQPTQQDLLQKQMADLQAKIDAMNAEAEQKAKAEAEKKASEEKEKLVVALAEKEKEIEALKKQTIGDDSRPDEGLSHSRQPLGIGLMKTDQHTLGIKATRTFAALKFPHFERYYKDGMYKDGTKFNDYREGGPEAVSILETNLNYTWNGVLDLDIFFKPTLGTPALGDLALIDTGAHFLKRYHLYTPPDNILKPYLGCAQPVTGTSVNITSKAIQLKKFQMYEQWCADDFTDYLTGIYNVLAQEWIKSGNDQFDPAGTPIHTIIMDGLKDGLRRSIFRRLSFGSISSSSDNYNQIDGMITNLINDSGASNYCVTRSGSALGLGALSAGQSNTILAGLYDNSSLLLQQEGIDKNNTVIWVTRSIWNNYYTYLTGVGAVTEQQYGNYIKGITTLMFRGVPVRPVSIWDSFLAESTNPFTGSVRHIALMTIKENHIFGIENTGDLNKIKSWFSDDDNVRRYRANMSMGYQKIHCDLTTIAY